MWHLDPPMNNEQYSKELYLQGEGWEEKSNNKLKTE